MCKWRFPFSRTWRFRMLKFNFRMQKIYFRMLKIYFRMLKIKNPEV